MGSEAAGMNDHPECPPNAPLFTQLATALKSWVFVIDGRMTIPIASARGPWREVIGRCAESIWGERMRENPPGSSEYKNCQHIIVAWIIWREKR